MTEPAPLPPTPPAPPTSSRTRRRRLAMFMAGGTLVVTGAAAGGVAVGAQLHGGTTQQETSTSTTRQWQGGYGGWSDGSPGGSSGGSSSGGMQGMQGQGLQGQQQTQDQTSDQTTSDATTSQTSGLVFITSTLADGEARGTGIVLTSDGEIVTNHHVVAGATKIEVTIASTNKTYTATYVGGDSTKDVAVLQLEDASGLTTAKTSTAAVSVGDTVTAVGDANGDRGTMTAAPGTVTATDESITVSDEDGTKHRLTGLVEMDADLISGDSGGAVRDSDGTVVAMNVAASSGSANVTGYAIPWATVTSVADQITAGQASSEVTLGTSGYLGVGISTQSGGPLVVEVTKGGPAADAGIEAGDTITSVGGTNVSTRAQLSKAITSHAGGDEVSITWTDSDGDSHTATVTLDSIVA
ncbi:PDZ domain-containing protein [Nocardioides mangrovicus]|uniref:PDZ domain-containing protein n=1 Tax=Nocardioides mangrovicus TaxID=2478913 RepID=A0A3L8P0U3_9ACTN|nr:trypsin-like peptidase domain-containing protein [Nocardioides mangrovicus]RLV48537.1 PDZ domain-containing protein [Nocardioides mangrovicus]